MTAKPDGRDSSGGDELKHVHYRRRGKRETYARIHQRTPNKPRHKLSLAVQQTTASDVFQTQPPQPQQPQQKVLTKGPLDVPHPVRGHIDGDVSVPENVHVGPQLAYLSLERVGTDNLFGRSMIISGWEGKR